jgi:hypothetical protein
VSPLRVLIARCDEEAEQLARKKAEDGRAYDIEINDIEILEDSQ